MSYCKVVCLKYDFIDISSLNKFSDYKEKYINQITQCTT